MKAPSIQLVSLSPIVVGSLPYRDVRGASMLTVIAKATLDLLPADPTEGGARTNVEARLAAEQEPITDDDNHWDDDASRSVFSPTDLVPFKARADVLLVGYAFSPGGERVRSVTARLQVGAVDKSIRVVAERYVATDGSVHEGLPFTKMPLRYERSPGGVDTPNPVGIPADNEASVGRALLPNLLPVEGASATDYVGFGPIASTWPERRKRLGRREGSWPVPGWREMPLPIDVEPAYFNCAPPEQRVDAIRGDETITLENLHALEARLVTRLPGVRPRAFFETTERAPEEIALACDTLWIDTNRAICTLTWRGQLALGDARRAGRVLVALEGRSRALVWEDVKKRCIDLDIGPLDAPSEGIPQPPMTQLRMPAVRPTEAHAFTNGDRASLEETTTSAPLASMSADQRRALARGLSPLEPHDPTDDTLVARMRRPGREGEAGRAARPIDIAVVSARRTDDLAPALLGASSSQPPPTTQNTVAKESATVAQAAPQRAPSSPDLGERVIGAPRPALDKLPISPPGLRRPPAELASTAISPTRTQKPPPPPRASRPSPPPAASKTPRPASRDLFDLVWADASAVPRARRERGFSELVRAPERTTEAALDELAGVTGDDGRRTRETERDRRSVLSLLARAPRTDADGLAASIASVLGDDGELAAAPLVVVNGGLTFPFHEVESLRATVIALSLFAPASARIREAIERAERVLSAPWSASATAIAEAITQDLDDAFAEHQQDRPIGYLERCTERILLEGRHYQRRVVLGGRHVRGLVVPFGATSPVPVYLPDAASDVLPMFRAFRASLLAEVVMQQDQREEQPVALRALALARVLPMP